MRRAGGTFPPRRRSLGSTVSIPKWCVGQSFFVIGVACAVRTSALPPASFRAHGARYGVSISTCPNLLWLDLAKNTLLSRVGPLHARYSRLFALLKFPQHVLDELFSLLQIKNFNDPPEAPPGDHKDRPYVCAPSENRSSSWGRAPKPDSPQSPSCPAH